MPIKILSLESYFENLTSQINFYYGSIVIPIGIILNLVTITVFCAQSEVATNLNLIYIGLGIYDILALLNSILFSQLLPSLGIVFVDSSRFNCVFFNWWRKVAIQAPSWVQVLLTFERYTSVVLINKLDFFKNKRNVLLALVSIMYILIVVNSSAAWFYISTTVHNGSNSTKYVLIQRCTSSIVTSFVTDCVNLLFRFVLPFVVMIWLNVMLSRNLYASKRRANGINFRANFSSNSSLVIQRKSFRRELNYTITILGFNILFCALNLPWAVWYILVHIEQVGVWFQSRLDTATLNLLNSIFFSIFYINNYSSFVLNICFNRVFRSTFLFLVGKLWPYSSSSPSPNSSLHRIRTPSQRESHDK